MLKKNQLSEKLKKLKIEGASLEKPLQTESKKQEPLEAPSKVEAKQPVSITKPLPKKEPVKIEKKAKEKDQKSRQKRPVPAVEKETPKEEPILRVKNVEEIKEKKPEEFIEPLIQESRTLTFISDLAIPAKKLSKLFRIETTYTEDTLNQILTAWKDTEKVIKWTAKIDRHGQEFYSLRSEGLVKMKDDPPIYGMEFEDGAIISTHMGDYTFIMGCYNFDVKTLVKIFAYGIENVKRFNL